MTPRVVSERAFLRAIVALGLVAIAPSAFALSFGAEQVTSFLGQPLRMSIPLLGAPGDSLEARCFRIVPSNRADGLSVINQGRVELDLGATPRLLVRSLRSVDEPVVRLAIEAVCDTPMRREYTILLDPPPLSAPPQPPAIVPPLAEAGTRATDSPVAASIAKPPPSARERSATGSKRQRVGVRGSAGTTNDSTPVARTKSPSRSASPSAGRGDTKPLPQRADELRVQGGAEAGGVAIEDASIAALAIPRLRISSDLPSFDAGTPVGEAAAAAGGNELQAAVAKERRARLFATPIEEDLAPRLEADLVVAQRRLAELQAQIAAAGGVANAKAGTGASAGKSAPPGTAAEGWDWRKWLWVPASLLVLGLIVFLLRQRRAQRAHVQFANAGPVTVVQTGDDFDTVMPTRTVVNTAVARSTANVMSSPNVGESVAATGDVQLPTAATTVPAPMTAREASEASDRLISPLFQLRDTESHVDVTELSQITDEAQVYADLGRNDQAIEILRAHIDSQEGQDVEHSSPAPWLMIFDLYRRTNNRAGYDELAPRFRKQFNGRMPDWDNYGHELALDDGLEAFPHLVARIERDWGTIEAKKFLEELLYDNRGGSRLGFSLAAYRDILLLLQLHEGIAAGAPAEFPAADWESRGANDADGTPKWDLSLDMIDAPKPGELDSFLRNMPPPEKS